MRHLPFNLDNLLHPERVEDVRVEYKATWDDNIREAATRTTCAFANDLLNLNGGYIVLGVDDDGHGRPVLPPRGLAGLNIERIQQEIRGQCRRIEPECAAVCFTEVYQGRSILVVRVPAGDNRPYKAPPSLRAGAGERLFYVRTGSQTVEARDETLRQLIELTNRTPFDSRRSTDARLEDISPTLVRRYLADVHSDLIRLEVPDADLYRTLNLTVRTNGHEVPRNIALLMFSEQPDRFFRGAYLDVAHFGDDAGGDVIEERPFKGPLPAQIREVLAHLESMTGQITRKQPAQAEAIRFVAYPYEAMEEAIVNAVYHRSYQEPEPVKIYLYPDRMEITSYPGPVAGIRIEHLTGQSFPPPVPARNQRTGEFLKDLRLAERRNTGLAKMRRKMQENGSPAPTVDFGETYFRVTLPAHPGYVQLHAIREAAQLWATGAKDDAIQRLSDALAVAPGSGAVAGQLIEYLGLSGDLHRAAQVYSAFRELTVSSHTQAPYLRFAEALFNAGRDEEAKSVLDRVPSSGSEAMQVAILHKRAGNHQAAHQFFEQARPQSFDDPKFLQEFAQTKMQIAGQSRRDRVTNTRLLREAEELLRRAISLSDQPARTAWCWFDLARISQWLHYPDADVESAFRNATAALPGEPRIQEAYQSWTQRAQ